MTENQSEPEKKNNLKSEIIDWVKTLLIYCVIPVAVFEIFCFMATVPTCSMEDTIPTGAKVFVTRCFDKDNVSRGDVIVFNSDELGKVLVKRCIGLPGDTVEFDGSGDVYVNGELLEEEYLGSNCGYEGTFVVPEDCYFFCGDNRAESWDARYWDNPYIEKDKIMGKARFVLFPFDAMGKL